MKEEERAAWEKTRARGAWRYVMPFVLLVGGVPTLLLLASDYYHGRWPFVPDELWREKFWYLVGGVFLQLLLGVLAGCFLWAFNERRHKKHAGAAPGV